MPACLMDVEKGHDVSFPDLSAIDVADRAARLGHSSYRDVTRDDGKRDVELSMMEMNIGSADLRVHRGQQRRSGLELWPRILANLERPVGARHHDGLRHTLRGKQGRHGARGTYSPPRRVYTVIGSY